LTRSRTVRGSSMLPLAGPIYQWEDECRIKSSLHCMPSTSDEANQVCVMAGAALGRSHGKHLVRVKDGMGGRRR